jgi:putative colanic acid biosynthesis acetyltransferase WcaF
MQVELNKYNNNWYKPGKNKLVVIAWYFANRIFLNSYYLPISSLKVFVLKLFGAKIGKNVNIKPKVNIKYPWKLTIGDYTWIGEHVWIDNLDDVRIGKNCCLSQGAMLLCGNHNHTKPTFDLITKPIILKDGAWVGAQAVVCPGVTMENNAILTVSSVATKNLEANSIYQGNPAVKIKDRKIEA